MSKELKIVKIMRRFEKYSKTIRTVELLVELVVLSYIYYVVWDWLYNPIFTQTLRGNGKFILMLVYGLISMFIFFFTEGYQFGHRKISSICLSQIVSMFISNVIALMQLSLMANKLINPLPMLYIFVLDAFICVLFTYLYSSIYHRHHKPYDMLLICCNDKDEELLNKLNGRPDKYRVKNKINPSKLDKERVKEEISKHEAVLISDVPAELRNDILKYCFKINMRTYIVPKFSDIIISNSIPINLFDTPVNLVNTKSLSIEQEFFKRLFDIIFCLIILVPALPLMAITALAIYLEDGQPVLFKQKRITKDERVFTLIKFRSMRIDAEKNGYTLNLRASEKDPRITKVGKFIRTTRLDELPQIFNILKGDMSIVGPRPERIEHHEEYSKTCPEWVFRTKVKAGLTGYAQIYGKYNTLPYDKARLDVQYIEQYSFLLDLKLIIMTVPTMFKKESTEGFKSKAKLQTNNI